MSEQDDVWAAARAAFAGALKEAQDFVKDLATVRSALIESLEKTPPGARERRQLLITLRKNERLYQEIFRRPSDDPAVPGLIRELEQLLAAEREARRARRQVPHE